MCQEFCMCFLLERSLWNPPLLGNNQLRVECGAGKGLSKLVIKLGCQQRGDLLLMVLEQVCCQRVPRPYRSPSP